MSKYDFSGWATKSDIRCSDGRTIKENAFADCDGKVVPLVWNHQHNEPENVLGHALLKNVKGGVRAYGYFNNTDSGQRAKELVNNGDIASLSIYANQLKQNGGDVLHGTMVPPHPCLDPMAAFLKPGKSIAAYTNFPTLTIVPFPPQKVYLY